MPPRRGSATDLAAEARRAATRSRRAREADASAAAARTAASSVPSSACSAAANVSRKSTTSALCSGCWTLTYGSRRRAVARQLMLRTRSPAASGRRSANSMPSPRSRETRLPSTGRVRSGATRRRSRSTPGTRGARRLAERALERERPETVARADDRRPDLVDAPAARDQVELHLAHAHRAPSQNATGRGSRRSRARRRQGSSTRAGPPRVAQRHGRRTVLALERSVALEAQPTVDRDPRLADQRDAPSSSERQREHGELRSARRRAPQRGGSPRARRSAAAAARRERCILPARPRTGGDRGGVEAVAHDVLGVTRWIHSSGRSAIRCARAGTATA